jgi:hypothetical protein
VAKSGLPHCNIGHHALYSQVELRHDKSTKEFPFAALHKGPKKQNASPLQKELAVEPSKEPMRAWTKSADSRVKTPAFNRFGVIQP